jgi:hypothetical protein
MPQLVKGGKYVFGWTVLRDDLRIRIPDETYEEYKFIKTDQLIIMSGSKSSGGFSICSPHTMSNYKLSNNIFGLIGYVKESDSFTRERLEMVKSGKRLISWTYLDKEKYFMLSKELVDSLDLETGCRLLVGRGSGMGPAFISKGIIFNEALKHRDLLEYQ